jgi:hypothetical protein
MHDATFMSDRRLCSRRRVYKTALLIVSDKAPRLECAAKNVSQHGARMAVSTTYGIPSDFDLVINGVRRRCRSVWRTDTQMGVAFV